MPRTHSKIPPRLILTVAGVLLAVLVVHLAGVALLRYFVERTLHPALPQGTYIGEVHVNLFTGALRIQDFELRNEGRIRMRFGELDVAVSPWRLLGGAVRVEHAVLRQAYVSVERRPDGTFDLGLPPFGTAAGPQPAESTPPDLTIAGLVLDGLVIDYRDGDLASVLTVDELKAGAYSARADRQQIPLEWEVHWDGQPVRGEASVTLDGSQVAAAGRLETGLLDVGRAQRLARLTPLASGQIGYRGTIDWQAPHLAISGAVEAPALNYANGDQQLALQRLDVPALTLDLVTAPTLGADLALAQPIRLDALRWRAVGQSADAGQVRLTGRLRYRNDAIAAEGVSLQALKLAWQDAGRGVTAADVDLTASVQQSLASGAGLPTLSATGTTGPLDYRDDAQAVSARLSALTIDALALTATGGEPGRALQATLGGAAGRVAQGASSVGWSSVTAKLGGRLADTPSLRGDVALGDMTLTDPGLPHGPLRVGRVTADGLAIAARTGVERLRLAAIDLPAESAATALKVAAIELDGAGYAPTAGVAIDAIVIDGLQTGVIRDDAGAWRHVMSGGPPATAATSDKASAQGDNGVGNPAWRIGGLRITGDSHVTVADKLNPGMQPIRYALEKVEVGALASTAPQRDTPFEIALRPDAYSEFRIAGVVRPLASKLYLKAEGHLQGFGLTSVNGLVANDLGHRFTDGQIDDEFTITIDADRLDMGNQLAMAGLAVEAIPGKDGPPLDTAIALLEDRDGNIKLEVPVAGDLSDPQFRVLGALNPIIMKAVAGTAALAIQPFGSVLLVGSLLADQALKVTFEPALFAAGTSELDGTAQKYLGQLAARLHEKPKLRVRVCGVVVDAERPHDKKGVPTDTEADALALAQRRADAVRAYMTRQGAAAAQLRACRPSIDAAEAARPRVDIRF